MRRERAERLARGAEEYLLSVGDAGAVARAGVRSGEGRAPVARDDDHLPVPDEEVRAIVGEDSPVPEPIFDIRSFSKVERRRLGLTVPVATEWCVPCLRRLHQEPDHVCRQADDTDRCSWCMKSHGLCAAVSIRHGVIVDTSLTRFFIKVPQDLREEAKFVQDAYKRMTAAKTEEKKVNWATILMQRASVFRLHSISYNRLRKREPPIKNTTEAVMQVVGALANIEDTMRAIVSLLHCI